MQVTSVNPLSIEVLEMDQGDLENMPRENLIEAFLYNVEAMKVQRNVIQSLGAELEAQTNSYNRVVNYIAARQARTEERVSATRIQLLRAKILTVSNTIFAVIGVSVTLWKTGLPQMLGRAVVKVYGILRGKAA